MTMTSKISRSVSMALMAVAAVGASAGAFAATNPTQGQTDLFVAVWNTSTGASYVEDLGSAFSYTALGTTFDGANYTTSFSVDGGNLASTLGTGTYDYQLFAGDYFTSTGTYAGNTAFLSLAKGSAIPTNMTDGQLVGNAIGQTGSITSYLASFLPGSTTSFTGTTTGSGGNSWNANNASPGFSESFQIGALLNIGGTTTGSAENLIYYVAGSPDLASSTVTGTAVGNGANIGVFNLSSSGLLTYSDAPSTVPLPAAGWLLISGLLGLLAVSRRKDAEAL